MPRLSRDSVYRFLLRMAQELRERLSAAAAERGTSLNREIVDRLQASFDLATNKPSIKGRGVSMKRKLIRPAIVVGMVVAVAVLAAATLGVQRSAFQPMKAQKLRFDPDLLTKKGLPAVKRTPLGNPRLAALDELSALAYPASSVTAVEQKAARDFFTGTIKARGNQSSNSWHLAGPQTATVAGI